MAKSLAITSQTLSPNGLIDGELKPCSEAPNCFTTEGRDGLLFDNPSEDWKRAQLVLVLMGGIQKQVNDYYAHYEFTSTWLGFVDDVQVRQDTSSHTLHFKSSSRVGYYDFNANFKRYKRFREMF